jgi:hypothetical protein
VGGLKHMAFGRQDINNHFDPATLRDTQGGRRRGKKTCISHLSTIFFQDSFYFLISFRRGFSPVCSNQAASSFIRYAFWVYRLVILWMFFNLVGCLWRELDGKRLDLT